MRIEIEIDCTDHDPAFCMFAGFRHIHGLDASWKTFVRLAATISSGQDPTDATWAVIDEATARLRLDPAQIMLPLGESWPGYAKFRCVEDLAIEIWYADTATFFLGIDFSEDQKHVVRKLARYIYEAYEGEVSSAAMAMATIDAMERSP